jgi:hypothetical protein
MIGYKAFDENLQCRGFQFEVGKTYDTGRTKEDLRLCGDTVFHFCRELNRIEDVSNYCISKSRVCEVIAEGDVVTDGDKYGTNKLTIVREIPREELNKYNSCNTGKYNSGDCNSGHRNSGDYCSGNSNSGDYCSGNRNSGNYCSGNWNSGDCNSGNYCSGNWNSGDYCSGNSNSGDYCSGNRNSGKYCSGNWNSGNWNSGYFNTDSPLVRIFNKETDVPRNDIDFPIFLYFDLTVWVSCDTATDEERETHKIEIETCGGFTKTISYKEAFRRAWNKTSKGEREKLLKLPNWNNEIFMEISGIDAEAEIAKE